MNLGGNRTHDLRIRFTVTLLTELRGWTENVGDDLGGESRRRDVPIQTTPEEKAAFFLRLGLPSTLIRHENTTFRKRSLNQKNLQNTGFRFRVNRKHFEDGAF